MTRNRFVLALVSATFGLSLVGCGQPSVEAAPEEAVVVEEIDNSDVHRITVSEHAARRLDLKTAAVAEAFVDGQRRLVVPASAVMWDAQGAAWAYTSPQELVYIRAPLNVERVEAEEAILSEGPEAGTPVVTVGVAELWGAETGVGGGH